MIHSLIIAGSRTVSPTIEEITRAVSDLNFRGLHELQEIVCGCARGADKAGEAWAIAGGLSVHHEPITAELVAKHGKYLAPKMRNRLMAERADAALIFWDGTSGGSADMACRMVARGKPVQVIPWRPRSRY